MTSPATSPGPVPNVNLALHWVTENDLVDAAIAAVRVRLPEWVPVEGNTEVVLLEGIALQTAQEVFTLNQLPRVVFEAVLEINGLIRQTGVAAQAQLFITTTTGITGDLVLPVDSRFRAPLPDGTTVDFLTIADETVPSGAVDHPVWARCETLGTRPHGIAAGTTVSAVSAPTWVEVVRIGTAGVSGGIDPESDQEFWTRGAAYLRSRPSSLVTAQNFADAAEAAESVGRAAAWERWDGTGAVAGVGTDLGHVTVAVVSPSGTALTGPQLAEIQAGLSNRAQAGLSVHVVNAVYVSTLTVTLSVVAEPGVNPTTLKPALEADLREWLGPLVWQWGGALTTNALIVRAARFPGVAAVTATGGTNWTATTANPNGLFQAGPTVTATVVSS